MRRAIFIGLLCLISLPTSAVEIGNDTVCFVPGPDDCASLIAAEIAKAQHTLDVQQFQLTQPYIAQAILAAHDRGVIVRLLLDKKAPDERNGQTPALAAAGIPVWVDYEPHIAHSKVIVIDGQEVIGGSFNLTTSAERRNAENATIIRNPDWATAYEKNFEDRLAVSEPLAQYETEHP